MIHHNKAVRLHCIGGLGCGIETRRKEMGEGQFPTTIVTRMCVGNKCMAWIEGDNGFGECSLAKKPEERIEDLEDTDFHIY